MAGLCNKKLRALFNPKRLNHCFLKRLVLASCIFSFIHPVECVKNFKFSLYNNLRAFTCAVLRFCSHHLHILFGFSLRSARAKAFSSVLISSVSFSRTASAKALSFCFSYFLSVFSLGMVIFFLGIPAPSFGYPCIPACTGSETCTPVITNAMTQHQCFDSTAACPCGAGSVYRNIPPATLGVTPHTCGTMCITQFGRSSRTGAFNFCAGYGCPDGEVMSCRGVCGPPALTSCTTDSDCSSGEVCSKKATIGSSALTGNCVDPNLSCPCGKDYIYDTTSYPGQGEVCLEICTNVNGRSTKALIHSVGGTQTVSCPIGVNECSAGQTMDCKGNCIAQTCTPACQPDEDCVNGTCMTKCRSDQVRNATTNACECPSGYTNTDSCNNEICALDSCATGKGIKISTTDGSQSCHTGGSNACPSGLEEITFGDVTFCLGENSAGSGQYVYPDGVARSLCTGSDEMRLPGDNYTNCNTCCGSTQDRCGGICVAQCRTDQVRNTTTCACECSSGYVEQNGACVALTNFVPGKRCSFDYEPKIDDSVWEIDPSERIKKSAIPKTFCGNPNSNTQGDKCYYSYQQHGWFAGGGNNYFGTCVTQQEENDPSYMKALCHYHCGSTDPVCSSFTKNSSAVVYGGRRTITWNRTDGSASQDVSQKAARLTCTKCSTPNEINVLGGGDGMGCKNLEQSPKTCSDNKDFVVYAGGKYKSWPECRNTCEAFQDYVNLKLSGGKYSQGMYWHRGDYYLYPTCEISGERRGYEKNGSCQSACPPGQLLTCTGCLNCGPGKVLCGKTCVINSDGTATPSNCCVPECTGGRIMDNDCTCICPDPNKEWCSGTNQCVDLCKNGKVRDPSACTCGCPTGQTVQSNGNCGVTQTRVPNTGQTTLDTFGGNPAVPSGMWASSFNLQGSPAFRSVYTIGRADRPDFICWKKTTTTGAVDTILPHYFCPERQSCALGEDCPCQTVHGKEVPDTYCDYANMDPMRGYSEPEPVQGAVDHPINVGVKSITINVVPP